MSTRSRTTKATEPNTRRIGCAKLSAEYCVAGLASGKPQSHAGARRRALEARRWITLAASEAETAMNRNTSSPLYELRLCAIGAIESHAIPACAGIRPPTAPLTAGDRASMNKPGNTPATRQRAASENIAASAKRLLSRAFLAASVRGRPRNVIPNALAKHAAASAAESASSAPTAGANILSTQDDKIGLSRMA